MAKEQARKLAAQILGEAREDEEPLEDAPVDEVDVDIEDEDEDFEDSSDEDDSAGSDDTISDEERQNLIKNNLGLAVSLAQKFNAPGVDMADKIQSANMALVKAAHGFNPSKGKFAAYAGRAIRNALSSEFNRAKERADHEFSTLDDPLGDDGTETELDLIASEEEDPSETTSKRGATDALNKAIDALKPKEARMIRAIMADKSVADIAAELDMTRAGVYQRLNAAYAKLRSALKSAGYKGSLAMGESVLNKVRGALIAESKFNRQDPIDKILPHAPKI